MSPTGAHAGLRKQIIHMFSEVPPGAAGESRTRHAECVKLCWYLHFLYVTQRDRMLIIKNDKCKYVQITFRLYFC